MKLTGKEIVLGVTGGIAAYKSAEVVSRLRKQGAQVHVIMTENATKFVAPLTFETLSNHPVVTDTFARPDTWEVEHIALACGGDLRKAMNAVEVLFSAGIPQDGKLPLTLADAKQVTQKSALRADRDGDNYYDLLSALHKSIRGSDPDAACHYLARLLEAGQMPSACRRLMCVAAEDVGLAYPQILPIVNACVDMALKLGMPEARLPLADAAVLMATSPKSNSAYLAIDAALDDVRKGKSGDFPRHLQNVHADTYTMEREQGYLYPHNYPNHWVKQQYLPDELVGAHYYEYGPNKLEQAAKQYWDSIKKE